MFSVKYFFTRFECCEVPVLSVEREADRVIVEVCAGSKEYYNQIFDQLILNLCREVKGLSCAKWNSPPYCDRMIVDY